MRSVRFLLLAAFSGSSFADEVAGADFFEAKIRPVLAEHCYRCHSAEAAKANKLKGGLRLDTRAGVRGGGDSGPAVVPGKAAESLLLSALRQDRFEMPPKGKLPDAVVADFVKWVEMGAPDPREQDAAAATDTVLEEKAREAALKHWAFAPPVAVEPPAVKLTSWPREPLDHFTLAEMERRNLKPAAAAEPGVWVRRLYFDLIGLPPSPEEVARFVEAASEDRDKAVDALVEELLASPHYGERWGRHWLDVARYAEDQAHTFGVRKRDNAFQYRDWVIRALNDDLPFDQFVKLQIAGDLMEKGSYDPARQLAGLGFLGLGAQYYKNSDKARAEADELDDAIDTLTRGFLGLTVSCARCHDHKYDPIPTADYYSLAGIFNGRSYTEAPLAPDEETKAYEQGRRRVQEQEGVVRDYLREVGRRNGRERFGDLGRYALAAWRMNALQVRKVEISDKEVAELEDLHPYFVRRFRDFLKPGNKNEALKRLPELKAWFEPDLEKLTAGTEKADLKYEAVPVPEQIKRLAESFQRLGQEALDKELELARVYEEALAKATDEKERKQVRREKPDKESERVLKFLWRDGRAPFYAGEREAEREFLNEGEKEKLAELREELEARKKNAPAKYPTAHVIRGGGRTMQVYVRGNPANKGAWAAKGFLSLFDDQPKPTDPKEAQGHAYTRLDLANDVASPENPLTARVIVNRVWQWHFGRGLVGSASNFGLAGERPTHPELLDWLVVRFVENGWSLKWLHRQIVRSATYGASGAGNPANAEIDADNHFLWRFNRRRLDVESWRDALLAVSGKLDAGLGGPTLKLEDSKNHRRTVYASISRHRLNGLLRLFDFPDPNVSSAGRVKTTVPQQQLFALNSGFFIEQAKGLAARLQREAERDDERVRLAYRLAFGREPSDLETQLGLAFVGNEKETDDKVTPWEQYCQALLATNEFTYLD